MIHPGASLLGQIAECSGDDWPFQLRAIAADLPEDIERALARARAAVIDATWRPADAGDLLEKVTERVGREQTLVYTERTQPDLEIYVRSCGVQFMLGPMSREEWGAWLAGLPARDQRLAPAGLAPRPYEHPTLASRRPFP